MLGVTAFVTPMGKKNIKEPYESLSVDTAAFYILFTLPLAHKCRCRRDFLAEKLNQVRNV